MAANFSWSTTGDEAVKKFADQIKGKTVLVTGVAPNSLGGEAAVAISKAQPKLILLSARSEERIAPIAEEIKKQGVPTKSVATDLASFATIRKTADDLISSPDLQIDVIINSAGLMATPWGKTEDGIEQQFAVNHLAHFLLTNLLLKAGKVAEGGRIINLTSGAHMSSGVRWDDYNFQDGAAYEKWVSYGQAKTANILYSVALADRLKARNITSFSVHPGVIQTNLGRHMTAEDFANMKKMLASLPQDGKYNFNLKTLNQGTSAQIVAAFSPAMLEQNGAFIFDCQVQEAAPHARSLEDANRLWKLSEELVGEKFTF